MARKVSLVVSVFTGLLLSASAANASSIYPLTSDHCTGGCGPAGTVFGLVLLDQNGSNVDVTVKLNHVLGGYDWAKTGAADMMAFKFNATGVVLGDITVNQSFAGETLAAATGAFNGDGTGNFTFGIQCTTCGGGLSTVVFSNIVFHVANATIADLVAPNNLGNIFVADVGIPGANTGPVDASFLCPTCGSDTFSLPASVPEPTSLILLGSGLVAAATRLRRRAAR